MTAKVTFFIYNHTFLLLSRFNGYNYSIRRGSPLKKLQLHRIFYDIAAINVKEREFI